MNRNAKNYLCILLTAAGIYFASASVLRVHELKEWGEQNSAVSSVSTEINAWSAAAAAEGLIGGAGLGWLIVSRNNKKTPHEAFKSQKARGLVGAGAALGLFLGYGGSAGLMGSIPSIQLPSIEIAANPETEQNEESQEEQPSKPDAAVTADIFPVRSGQSDQDDVQASGVVRISDAQELYDTYTSEQPDESALVVESGGDATLMGSVSKTGDASDAARALSQGINAAVEVLKDGNLSVLAGVITSGAQGSPDVAVHSGGTASLSDSVLTSSGGSSPVLFAGAGSRISGSGLEARSTGENSVSIAAQDTGQASMDSSVFSTEGNDAAFAYGSGSIAATNCSVSLQNAPAAVLEKAGSLQFDYSNLSTWGSNGVFQIRNKEKSSENASVSMTGSYLTVTDSDTSASAPLMTVEKGVSSLLLNSNIITLPSGKLAEVQDGKLNLSLQAQTIEGRITADEKSSVDIDLTDGSVLSTAINSDNSGATIDLHLDESSYLYLIGDCHVSSLNNDYGSNDNIAFNGFTIYVDGVPVTY